MPLLRKRAWLLLDAEVAERLEVGFDVFFHLRIGERDSSTEPAADASRLFSFDFFYKPPG